MTRNEALALGIGAVGVGGYLYYAYRKCWFPFSLTEKCKAAGEPGAPPAPTSPPSVQATWIDQNTLRLDVSWAGVTGATFYKILVNGNEVGTSQTTSATVTLTNVKPGDSLQVQIKACN